MSKELKITKEKILEASKQCEQAMEVLRAMFPEAFEGEERWVDITEEIDWCMYKFCSDSYWLMGTFAGEERFYFNTTGFHFNLEDYKEFYKIKISGDGEFRIFEKK